ncbi:hypothetical protein, partial [Acidithiobacillus sp.]|uniref:hypothetical protein n=1 Tax=Acidithiobacillus sp. TaxID=1872118 RepID=UPI0025B7B46A
GWPVFPAAGAPPLQAQHRYGIPPGLESALDMLPGKKRANVPDPALDLCLTVRSVLVLDIDAFHGLLSHLSHPGWVAVDGESIEL